MARSGCSLLSTTGELVTDVQGCGCVSLLFLERAQLSEHASGVAKTGHPTSFLHVIFAVLFLVVERWQFRMAYPSDSDCCEKLWFEVVCGLGCGEVLDFHGRAADRTSQLVRLRLPRRMGEEFRSSSLTCGLRRQRMYLRSARSSQWVCKGS